VPVLRPSEKLTFKKKSARPPSRGTADVPKLEPKVAELPAKLDPHGVFIDETWARTNIDRLYVADGAAAG